MRKREWLIFTAVIVAVVISLLVIFLSGLTGVGTVLALAVTLTVVALTVFFKPFYGMILYILMIYMMPHYYIVSLQKIRIMLVLAILILLVFFIHKAFRGERTDTVSSRHNFLMLALLILVFISNIANFHFGAAWTGFNKFFTVFFLFFTIANFTKTFEEFRKTYNTLIICTVLISINGLIMAFRGYGIMGNVPEEGRIIWTKKSHFGDPNDFALAIISFFPFILVNLFEENSSKGKKILLLATAAVMLIAIYYTNSRGGFIALMAILIFFAFKRWGMVRGIVVTVILLAMGVILSPSRMGNISPYEQSAGARIEAWITGLMMLKSRPIFGVGFNNFTEIHGRTAHSAFILCMAELGVVGYFVWLALIYSSYTGLKNVERRGSEIMAKYANIIQLSLTGFLFSAIFLSQAYTPILYILLGLSAGIIRLAEPAITQPHNLSARDITRIVGIIVGSIAAYKLLSIVYV